MIVLSFFSLLILAEVFVSICKELMPTLSSLFRFFQLISFYFYYYSLLPPSWFAPVPHTCFLKVDTELISSTFEMIMTLFRAVLGS